jgi:ubiquinone/menaquinone biosynthesis C-methylase UbiE
MIKKLLNELITKDVGTKNGKVREDWLEATLKNLPEGSTILDAGAGEGKYKAFCSHLNYFSQDIAEYDGLGDGKGIHTKKRDYSKLDFISDITEMPIEDNHFDSVMCVEVIEHVPDPLKAIKEIHRVLKVGGTLVLTAPFNSLTHYAPFHYSTGFSRYFYEFNLPKLGFELIEIQPNGNYFEYMAQEIRRLKTTSETYSNTKLNFITKLSIYSILNFLNTLSDKDRGSSDLQCFGYQIVCKKLDS